MGKKLEGHIEEALNTFKDNVLKTLKKLRNVEDC